ncbi:MAG: hypothetical protein ABR990_02900 [Terracidiphilus sp.]
MRTVAIFVAALIAVTLALGMTAPVESVTIPVILMGRPSQANYQPEQKSRRASPTSAARVPHFECCHTSAWIASLKMDFELFEFQQPIALNSPKSYSSDTNNVNRKIVYIILRMVRLFAADY